MLRELTNKILSGESLSKEEAESSLNSVFSSESSDVAITSFLTALKGKGETPEEIAGFAQGMRQHSVKIKAGISGLVDTAGTGGGRGSFNISTTAAFIIAAAGLPVAKHGNRAATSRSGSADMLEQLGVNLAVNTSQIEKSLKEIGLGFLFAPMHHPAMKRVVGIRKELGFRTIFNMLGPLTNPAGADYQLIGAFSLEAAESMANALAILGVKKAWVVHSQDGMDEISPFAPTDVFEVKTGQVERLVFDPAPLVGSYDEPELRGGLPSENAEISRAILAGKLEGAEKDVVILNASAAIHLAGHSFDEALSMALEALESGEALAKMKLLVEASNG